MSELKNPDFYSKEEFEEIRDKIAAIITEDEELKEVFTVKKTSYKQAQKTNWNIVVDVSMKGYKPFKDGNNAAYLVTKLITKYSEFINESENKFYFSYFNTRNDCAFYFRFQPVVIAAKEQLIR